MWMLLGERRNSRIYGEQKESASIYGGLILFNFHRVTGTNRGGKRITSVTFHRVIHIPYMETYSPFLPFIQEVFCEVFKTFIIVLNLFPQKRRVIHRYKQVIHSLRGTDKRCYFSYSSDRLFFRLRESK